MKTKSVFLCFCIVCIYFSNAGSEPLSKSLPFKQLIEEMQKGGLIIYIRHASTEKDYADQVSADVNDGSTQRVLSEKGWHEAVHIGRAFKFYAIPVGKVWSSEYFRAWQTAWLAFEEYDKNEVFNFLPFEDYTEKQMADMRKKVSPFLGKIPQNAKNTVIVAHDDPFEAATGIYPEPMGVCYIIEPHGNGKFSILGSINPDEWK